MTLTHIQGYDYAIRRDGSPGKRFHLTRDPGRYVARREEEYGAPVAFAHFQTDLQQWLVADAADPIHHHEYVVGVKNMRLALRRMVGWREGL